ncbi:hypothetical protein [Nocardia fluminea]|uniref:Uncharacterized protein n=1 Tax=Nocardia fluminea TaxID=134984 RepID=A0A2N3VGV4_9NOCA|nr:hypothetical protein [Nocardia fluminea]PKV80868.1 hypothetical protein ATK86_5305 [Nocardia fluminea]
MAREHARIWLRIWSDDLFRSLSPQAQHLFFVLLTSPSLSYAGVCDWRPGRIAANAEGWSAGEVVVAGDELVRKLFVVIDEDSEEAMLRSFIRNDDILKNPNVAVSMALAFGGIASRVLRGVVVHELKRLYADRPELKGWGRDAVTALLDRTAINPATYPLGEPVALPVAQRVSEGVTEGVDQEIALPLDKEVGYPFDQGIGYPFDYPLTEGLHKGVHQGVASLPAPAPAPATYTDGGPVNEVTHLAPPPETDTPTPSRFHEEHPDRWVPDCDECHELEAATAARLAAEAALAIPAGRCPEHLDNPTTAPCGPCGEARRARAAWDAERDRWRAERAADARVAAAEDRAREVADCALCDDDGYRGTAVCDHDPDTVDRAKRGSALVRAALAAKHADPAPEAGP